MFTYPRTSSRLKRYHLFENFYCNRTVAIGEGQKNIPESQEEICGTLIHKLRYGNNAILNRLMTENFILRISGKAYFKLIPDSIQKHDYKLGPLLRSVTQM